MTVRLCSYGSAIHVPSLSAIAQPRLVSSVVVLHVDPVNSVATTPEALRSARTYDAWFEATWGRYAFAVESRALLKAIGPVRGSKVLDAGCGTGRFSEALSRAGATVSGLDRDLAMLRVATDRRDAPLVLGDALALPFADRVFDVAVAVTLCEFAAQPERVVGELARVTRRGGRIVIGALNRASPWGVMHRRRLHGPPWDEARFFTWDELEQLGAPHGRVRVEAVLYAPEGLPALPIVGPALERMGRLVPKLGAFRVMSIDV